MIDCVGLLELISKPVVSVLGEPEVGIGHLGEPAKAVVRKLRGALKLVGFGDTPTSRVVFGEPGSADG